MWGRVFCRGREEEYLEHPQRPETEQEGHFRSKKGALWLVKSEHSREERILAVMKSRLGSRVRSWKHCSSYEGIGSHGEFEATEWRHVMRVFYLVYPKLASSFYVAEKDTKHLTILPPLPECRACRVCYHTQFMQCRALNSGLQVGRQVLCPWNCILAHDVGFVRKTLTTMIWKTLKNRRTNLESCSKTPRRRC